MYMSRSGMKSAGGRGGLEVVTGGGEGEKVNGGRGDVGRSRSGMATRRVDVTVGKGGCRSGRYVLQVSRGERQ